MSNKIYAYYQPLQSVDQPEEFACANAWKHSWEKQGWECIMLNSTHAKASNMHLKLVRYLMDASYNLPSELSNEFPKIMARYVRWCALHASGGGWMSDYDVVNVNFPAGVAEAHQEFGNLQVVSGEPAWIFYATQEMCAAAINKFKNSVLCEGNRLRTESELLDTSHNLDIVKDLLFHAKVTPDQKRSQSMSDLIK